MEYKVKNELGSQIADLEMTMCLLRVVKDGINDYIDHNNDTIDSAIYGVIILQETIIERMKVSLGLADKGQQL